MKILNSRLDSAKNSDLDKIFSPNLYFRVKKSKLEPLAKKRDFGSVDSDLGCLKKKKR